MQGPRFAAPGRLGLTTVVAALMLAGCSSGGIKTYPVEGKVEIKDGDAGILAGSHVKLRHPTDESLFPSGKITSSGNFAVQTLHQGVILNGAPEGTYKVCIVLADESDEGVPKRKGNPVHPRFLDVEKSGLTFTVPSGDYNLSLSRK